MPRFDRDPAAKGPLIQGFSGQGLKVDGQVYQGVILTPLKVYAWEAPPLADLSLDHLGALLEIVPSPEFVILGTGASMARAPRALADQLEQQGIGVEAMDSRAAARTWGILRGEERWIAAAIMPL